MQESKSFWLSILAIFVFGAMTSNAGWLYYTNVKDSRFEARVGQIERGHKYQMGQQRTKIEKKIDDILDKLNKAPSTPIIIDAREALKEAKSE